MLKVDEILRQVHVSQQGAKKALLSRDTLNACVSLIDEFKNWVDEEHRYIIGKCEFSLRGNALERTYPSNRDYLTGTLYYRGAHTRINIDTSSEWNVVRVAEYRAGHPD